MSLICLACHIGHSRYSSIAALCIYSEEHLQNVSARKERERRKQSKTEIGCESISKERNCDDSSETLHDVSPSYFVCKKNCQVL